MQQILWGERRARDEAGDTWELIRDTELDDVLKLTLAQRDLAQDAIFDALSRIPDLRAVCGSLRDHPWAWVANHQLTPFDQEEAQAVGARWRDALKELAQLAEEFGQSLGPIRRKSIDALRRVARTVVHVSEPSEPAVAVMARAMADERSRGSVFELLRNIDTTSENSERANTVVLSEIPNIADDWEDWHSQVDDSLVRVNELASSPESLDDAAKLLLALREDDGRRARVLQLARIVQEAIGVEAEVSASFANTALRAAQLISTTSHDVLVRRSPSLFKDGVDAILSSAITKVAELSEHRQSLDQVFVLTPLPSLHEVDCHVRALRGAGVFGFISKDFRQAKRFYRSIAAAGARVKTPEIIQRLTQLAAYLEAREKLTQDMRLAETCGRWFEGPDTLFNLLAEIHKWGVEVLSSFPSWDDYGPAVQKLLLEAPIEVLERIVEASKGMNIESGHACFDKITDKQLPLADIVTEVREKITVLEGAINVLSQTGITRDARLSTVGRVAERVRDLNQWRNEIFEAAPEHADRPISFLLVLEAFELASRLGELDLPTETFVQILTGDPSDNFMRLRDWSGRVEAALDREAGERRRVIELLHIVEESFAGAHGFDGTEPDVMIGKLDNALCHPAELGPWAGFMRAKKQAVDHGLGDLVTAMVQRETPAHEGMAAYNALVYRLLAKAAYEHFPGISEFDGVGIEQARDRFRKLDREIIDLQRGKIRSDLCHAGIPAGNGVGLKREFTDLALIRNELGKKKRHIPLRDLFDRAVDAIQQMKPCMMMSPLSVATYLKPGAMTFDLIVIDEASQMPPEDAIGALVRAGQCVIVGDRQQLPPTSFFRRFEDAMDIEDEEESEDLEVESILDQAYNVFLPPRQLRWHYRSRHQSLIAFSNKQFYENSLTVFPSPIEEHENFGVHLEQVNGQYADRHNPTEARAIAEWALDFMRHRAGKSLGIVAVNQLQRDLINDEMELLFQGDRRANAYREEWERRDDGLYHFFVKNLENVQGDERDVIAISTVYGPNADGRVMQNFGPISQRNGHRRLNVLLTRAREQVILFTSLKPERIEIRENTARGPRILRSYLDYALTKRLDAGEPTDRQPESDFEVAVANRLTRLGYEVVPQLGVAGFFIDLAVRHPDFPGTFLVGIECDGATYHSAKSARDRDRLREEVLTGQGWTIYRIWSTDWFRDADRETEKVRLFIERAAADRHALLSESLRAEVPGEQEEPSAEAATVNIDTEITRRRAREEELPLERNHLMAIPLEQLASEEQDAEALLSGEAERERRADDTIAINDTVTFHFVDDPDNVRTLKIVPGDADIRVGTISSHSPVGEALLDACVGEDVDIYAPQGTRTAVIDTIAKADTPTRSASRAEKALELHTDEVRSCEGSELPILADSTPWPTRAEAPYVAGSLAPYKKWSRKALPDPRETGTEQVTHHLREIIEAEGPIRVKRAYRLYAHACGINRVGRVVRSEFNKALHKLERQGEVVLEREGPDESQIAAIARITGTQKVVVRTVGDRAFWEVPPSEIAAIMQIEASKSFVDDEELYRRILGHYGIVRLTSKIYAELKRIRHRFAAMDP